MILDKMLINEKNAGNFIHDMIEDNKANFEELRIKNKQIKEKLINQKERRRAKTSKMKKIKQKYGKDVNDC